MEMGGYTACPESDQENTDIGMMVRDSKLWLGHVYKNGTLYLHDNTTPAEYANWAEGEPSQNSGVVMMDADEDSETFGQWFVQEGSEQYATVCERGELESCDFSQPFFSTPSF